MESEGRFMETLSAKVREVDAKYVLAIDLGDEEAAIPLSEDRPAAVKRAFGSLILRIKKGPIQIQLAEVGEDLFSEVAKEYVKQLNSELKAVRTEMEQHGLISS